MPQELPVRRYLYGKGTQSNLLVGPLELALAHVYIELASIVSDFCHHLGLEPPSWITSHPDEMGELAMDRAIYVSMRDGSESGLRLIRKEANASEKALKKRYGDQTAKWNKVKAAKSFKEFCEAYFEIARHLMIADGYHESFAFLLNDTTPTTLIVTEHPDRAIRYVLMRDLAHLARVSEANGVVLINEVWMAKSNDTPTGFAADSPNRTEALSMLATNSSCESYSFIADIIRKKKKKHKVKKLAPTEFKEDPSAWILYPFQKLWGCVDAKQMHEADKELIESGVIKDILIPLDEGEKQ